MVEADGTEAGCRVNGRGRGNGVNDSCPGITLMAVTNPDVARMNLSLYSVNIQQIRNRILNKLDGEA